MPGRPLRPCVPPPTLFLRLKLAPRRTSVLLSQSSGVTTRSERLRLSMSLDASVAACRSGAACVCGFRCERLGWISDGVLALWVVTTRVVGFIVIRV